MIYMEKQFYSDCCGALAGSDSDVICSKCQEPCVYGEEVPDKPLFIHHRSFAEKYWVTMPDFSTYQVAGKPVTYPGYEGIEFFVHHQTTLLDNDEVGLMPDVYTVSEKITGLNIASGHTDPITAIGASYKRLLKEYPLKSDLEKLIKEQLKRITLGRTNKKYLPQH